MTPSCAQAIVLALLLAAAAAAQAARTAGEATRELRDLRGRIEQLQKQLAAAEESHAEAVDALKESERAISDAKRALRELTQQAQTVSHRLSELEADASEARARLAAQQSLLARLLYQQYIGLKADPLRLMLNGQNPNQTARELHYLGYVTRARSNLIKDIQDALTGIGELVRAAEEQASELAAIALEQTAQSDRLEAEKRARAVVLGRISRDIQRQRREIGTLRRDEARLTRLIQQLSRIVAHPKAAPPRLRNERVPAPSAATGPFEAMKGRLALPVRGELGNRFGSPRPDGGPTWKGLFILARPGEEVRAIAGGRVVFADWLRGFGNLLIVDHGSAYMSLYGNNEALYKRVGEEIRVGEAIATVGNSGGNADSGLYFELRHEGKPLDPLTWVNVR